MIDFDRLSHIAVGARGDIRRLVFHEAARRLECFVPDDSLWFAVKDNLILSEYERGGISLRKVTGTVIDAGAHVGLFSLRVAPPCIQGDRSGTSPSQLRPDVPEPLSQWTGKRSTDPGGALA